METTLKAIVCTSNAGHMHMQPVDFDPAYSTSGIKFRAWEIERLGDVLVVWRKEKYRLSDELVGMLSSGN
jgi:hypothetical protein